MSTQDLERFTFNPDDPLRSTNLEESANQVFFSLATALADHGVKLTKSILDIELPGRVFDIAVAARWIPDPTTCLQQPASPLIEPERVRFGSHTVQKSFRDGFLWLVDDARNWLLDEIPEGADDERKRLSERIKRVLPAKYNDGTETPKAILDRRRKRMHLEWNELQELAAREYRRREARRRRELGLEGAKKLGLSVDSILSIRRGALLPQQKLEAIAVVVSSPDETVPWQALKWRNEFALK